MVQQVAANAEESAGTSEEIRSQAGQMYRIGLDPAGLVNGSSTDAAEKAGPVARFYLAVAGSEKNSGM